MKNLRLESIIIAAGLLLAGFLVYEGFSTMAERDRSVDVRGFSERTVNANKATWPINYKAFGNDLDILYADADAAKYKIISFLTKAGIAPEDIATSAPKVTDYNTAEYKPENIRTRYTIQMCITVSTKKVEAVRELTYRIPELIRQGISIVSNDYDANQLTYEYTDLDKIKPAMIEASTKNAREAAEKFAKDSGSKLGKIKRASQGYFSIENRDNNTPWIKKVRVVTSVSYYLKN